MNYRQCQCCGKYFEVNETNEKDVYCSEECTRTYYPCSICGHYYLLEDFADQEHRICSKECAKEYPFFQRDDNSKHNLKNL